MGWRIYGLGGRKGGGGVEGGGTGGVEKMGKIGERED